MRSLSLARSAASATAAALRPGAAAAAVRSGVRSLSAAAALRQASLPRDSPTVRVMGKDYATDSWTNVGPSVLEKLERRLHLQANHPLAILKAKIEHHMNEAEPGVYRSLDSLNPVVSPKLNFDDLLFEADHPGRRPTDTYYVNADNLLRTHTSAHQSTVLRDRSSRGYLLTADVYRRDEVDQTHYPVFHQMEGIRTFDRSQFAGQHMTEAEALAAMGVKDGAKNPIQRQHTPAEAAAVALHLKSTLENVIKNVFASEKGLQWRWNEEYFPFTSPSWELEVLYNGKWLELFGSGVVRQEIMDNTGNSDRIGWAFGLGLERIAMRMFNIPDIRLFWSTDERFTSQFRAGSISSFVPFSKYPPCYKDISFWTPPTFHDNDFSEVVREIAGDIAEEAKLIDEFTHPKTGRASRCYRINYRAMDRTLTNAEVDEVQERLRQAVVERCGVELR